MKFAIQVIIPLLAATIVSAHGVVSELTIAGKTFKGNFPGSKGSASVIRQVSTASPVKGATNKAVNCGSSAKAASLVADANPGDKISFKWDASKNENWPHNTGPMLTYMASCGSSPCSEFDTTKAKWFKIDQVGQLKGSSTWAQAALMKGTPATVTLPKTLAAGNYMIRHEIIALHLANNKGGAEFYPSCAQLKVGGSETGAPTEDELVSLPGAYSDSDPGIFDRNVFDSGAKYTFPGPPVAKFVSGAASGGSKSDDAGSDDASTDDSDDATSDDSDADAAPSSSAPAKPSSTPKPAKPSNNGTSTKGSCKSPSKKRAVFGDDDVVVLAEPEPESPVLAAVAPKRRHNSRVMRTSH